MKKFKHQKESHKRSLEIGKCGGAVMPSRHLGCGCRGWEFRVIVGYICSEFEASLGYVRHCLKNRCSPDPHVSSLNRYLWGAPHPVSFPYYYIGTRLFTLRHLNIFMVILTLDPLWAVISAKMSTCDYRVLLLQGLGSKEVQISVEFKFYLRSMGHHWCAIWNGTRTRSHSNFQKWQPQESYDPPSGKKGRCNVIKLQE